MNSSLQLAVTRNFLLKSKILLGIFCGIFILQVISISSSFISGIVPEEIAARAIIAPVIMILVIGFEWDAVRSVSGRLKNNQPVSARIVYLVTLLETAFPGIMFSYGTIVLGDNTSLGVDRYMLMNSPPELAYFFFIILSSLMLDFRLSLFVGIACGIQYALVSVFILEGEEIFRIMFTASKGLLMIAAGLVAGFVSRKIKESVNTAMEAQNILIHELDEKVKERTREIVLQKEEIEEKSKEITDSIQYAKRIQYALLAHDELLQKNLPSHFVLFQPKDIVSGDFYWATECQPAAAVGSRQSFYLAVCDSTGHGVPGAFMSLLNISFLNEAINEKDIHEPHEVLNYVKKKLVEKVEGGNDGMDAILLKFSGNKIQYAAANHKAVLIREDKITELQYDKMPVGNSVHNRPFTLHELECRKNDLLVFCTDGFSDQFGGPKGKKFKYSNLQKLLLKNASMDTESLCNLLRHSFTQWKGELEQIDDVCIIGIKF